MMKTRKFIIGILLACAALTAVLVPCLRLFEEGDWLFYVVREPAMKKAWIETAVLAALIAGCALLPGRKYRVIAWGLLLAAVCWLHGMLMPVLFAGVWFLLVMACGGPVRGTAAVIAGAAVLSAFKVCRPVTMLAVAAVTALMNYLPLKKRDPLRRVSVCRRRAKLMEWMNGESPVSERLLTGAVFLVVLIQIARANNCIDFDSLWYGVRSTFVLAPNGSIFEDLGLVGMVYTYPKGFEILTLPLSGTSSYTVITAFNLCLFLYGLKETGRIAELLAGEKRKQTAIFLTAMVPGIVNMTLSAKPDVITWMLQMTMLRIFFEGVCREDRKFDVPRVLAVYLLSLTMKPTAIIFSTALFGMMCICGLILKRKKHLTVPDKNPETVSALLLSALALTAVCARTFLLTGMPFTSVFTGIFEKLGFQLKYPFAVSSLPRSYQEGSVFVTALKRTVKMLLMPDGKDMSHVIIAWGGSLFLVLGAVILTGLLTGNGKGSGRKNPGSRMVDISFNTAVLKRSSAAVWIVFLPFLVTCFITLMMLYQVDGNYYMTLYSIVIFLACRAFTRLSPEEDRGGEERECGTAGCGEEKESGTSGGTSAAGRLFLVLPVGAVCIFQFFIMTMTNWAGTTGYSAITPDQAYYDHAAYYREVLTETDGTIYDMLAAEPSARLVAFGTHPDCLQFRCIAESYNDITSPWGNVEIVNSSAAFEEYLKFMKADYVYAGADHLNEEAWQWSKGLLEEMTADGTLYDFVYEGDNWLAKVRR